MEPAPNAARRQAIGHLKPFSNRPPFWSLDKRFALRKTRRLSIADIAKLDVPGLGLIRPSLAAGAAASYPPIAGTLLFPDGPCAVMATG